MIATIDLLSRVMMEFFDERLIMKVPTAGQVFFGDPANGSKTLFAPDANTVDIDIVKGNQKIAALIPRGMIARPLGDLQKNLKTGRFSTFSRKFPLAEEEGDVECSKLFDRIPGESAYSSKTQFQRAQLKVVEIHMESVKRILLMNEVLCFQSLLTGKMDAIIGTENPDLQYDFCRDHTHLTDTPGTKWNQAGSDPIGDMDKMADALWVHGHAMPDAAFMGSGAIEALIKNATVKELADIKSYTFVRAGGDLPLPAGYKKYVDSGWLFRGRLTTYSGYELYLFNYNGTYESSAGVMTRYMPTDSVMICNTGARCDRLFGPGESLPMDTARRMLYMDYMGVDAGSPMIPLNIMNPGKIVDPAMFYCDLYKSKDEKRLTVRTQEAPIFVTTQTDAFGVLHTVLL